MNFQTTNIEVDQSNKIEKTNKDSVIGFSNKINKTVLMKAKDKREIEEVFRETGRSKVFVYQLFALLIFIAIESHIKEINQIIIDQEYQGKEHLIKDYLLREIRKTRPDFLAGNIEFRRIGKKSKAHFVAYGVITKKRKPDKVVSAREVLKLLIK